MRLDPPLVGQGIAGDRRVYRAVGLVDLMVPVLKAIVERNNLDPNLIDDIHMGSAALRGAMITNILLVAGFPQSIAGVDCSRQCAPASNAIATAAHYIMNDDAAIMATLPP